MTTVPFTVYHQVDRWRCQIDDAMVFEALTRYTRQENANGR